MTPATQTLLVYMLGLTGIAAVVWLQRRHEHATGTGEFVDAWALHEIGECVPDCPYCIGEQVEGAGDA